MSLQIRGFGLISPLKLIRRGHIGNCFKREQEISKCKEILEAFDMDSVQFLRPFIKITTKMLDMRIRTTEDTLRHY